MISKRSFFTTGWMIPAIVLGLGLSFIVQAAVPARQSGYVRANLLAVKGARLSRQQAQQLEDDLKQDPGDLGIRAELIGYYFNQFGSRSARKALQKHVLWVIRTHPEADVAGIVPAVLDPQTDGGAYQQAAALWKKAVSAHPEDASVAWNAAAFFMRGAPSLAEKFLKRGEGIEPLAPRWPRRLGLLYRLQEGTQGSGQSAKYAGLALAAFRRAYESTQGDQAKSYLLNSLARSALEAGKTAKAKAYAEQALEAAKKWPSDWNAGNDVNEANTVLGLLALQAGHVDQARSHLIASAETKGSPQLKSFGPDMTLAWALWQKGDRKTVLRYLDLCGGFWTMGKVRLKKWSKTIKAGGTPDFGSNLRFTGR